MTVKITPTPNGYLKVEGDFVIQKPDGTVIPHHGERATLCRCGHSNNKPFCDDSHKKVGFVAD
jgi:CDGSH-type Zn-finger protein